MAQHLDEVQADLRQLRGRLEELEYSERGYAASSRRDLYSDLDKRLAALGGTAAAAAAGAAAGRRSRGRRPAEQPRAELRSCRQTTPPVVRPEATPLSSDEQTVYAQSFDALKAGSYSVAITGFKDFLASYPASPLAENAQYWLGEAYYVTHDYEAAAGAFRAVLQKWPDSRKAPDALLKLGYTQLEQKQYAAARATLTRWCRSIRGRMRRSSPPTDCAVSRHSLPSRPAVLGGRKGERGCGAAQNHRNLPLPAGRGGHRRNPHGVRAPDWLPAAVPVLRHRLRVSWR